MSFDSQFKKFHGVIKLTSNKKKELIGDGEKKGSRGALREKIKKKFKEDNKKVPKFYMQGSFSMITTINPISAEYDLDDGVYLQNIDGSKPINEWESPETVHKWVFDAIDGHTSKKPQDKNLCVRVKYADENKHVDLPIYAKKDDNYYLAVKNNGWIESDPKEISDWFRDEVKEKGEQYRRIVCYLKAWKDFREDENNQVKLYGGFQLTVLSSYNFVKSSCDEESFFKTIQNIYLNLSTYEKSVSHPKKYKNIIEHYTDNRKKKFVEEFETMYKKAKLAYEEEDTEEKSRKWRKVFGDRFPLCPKDKKGISNEAAPVSIIGATDISQAEGQFA